MKKRKLDWKIVRWVVALLLWAGVSLVACMFTVNITMRAILGDAIEQPMWTMIYHIISYALCLLLVIFVPWKVMNMKTSRSELGLAGLPTWTDLGLAPAGFVAYFVVAMLVTAVAAAIFTGVNWTQAQQGIFSNDLFAVSDKIFALISVVVLAPVAEEIIFRGWLYAKIRSKVPAWVGVLLVSLLFGLLHLGFDVEALQWNAAVNIFCMSVVLCALREITGTIWSGIILHMLKNGVAFFILYVGGGMY